MSEPRVDHDQRFKEMLREFVRELVTLFLTELAKRWLGKAEWLPQEVFTNPPLGLVKRVDLLGRVTEQLDALTTTDSLLHVEVESADSLTEVRKKIACYYPILRTQHSLAVTSLGVYLRVGLQGQGWDEYVERNSAGEVVYQVRWLYVGLPALPAEQYVGGDNWLGVGLSALMKIAPDRKAWLRAEILRRVATECHENDYRKLLLLNCAETYLPLEGAQEMEFLRLLREESKYQEASNMLLTTYDRGVADGETKGERKAFQEMIIDLATPHCGVPDESVLTKLRNIDDLTRLRSLVRAATTAQSWNQLLSTSSQ